MNELNYYLLFYLYRDYVRKCIETEVEPLNFTEWRKLEENNRS